MIFSFSFISASCKVICGSFGNEVMLTWLVGSLTTSILSNKHKTFCSMNGFKVKERERGDNN